MLILYGLLLGYTNITSKFGPRKSPTTGIQSYHYGLDIGAPTGSKIVAIFSGQVTYTGFNGANGFTVTISNSNISSSYSHVSPTFLVYEGQYVSQGEIVATVGPKNVYGVPNNPYKDSNGNPTNRFYYWSTFTFKHKERRQSRRSFKLFPKTIENSKFSIVLKCYNRYCLLRFPQQCFGNSNRQEEKYGKATFLDFLHIVIFIVMATRTIMSAFIFTAIAFITAITSFSPV